MNSTNIVGWTSEPQTRGTIGLVWSCLVTIFLCTWNAVHPNVPSQKDGAWRTLRNRIILMLFALTAPEFTCGMALDQLLAARVVQNNSPNWSLTQSFFLVMGGFAVEADGKLMWLEPADVLKLFDANILSWPDKSLGSEIMDRSKADWVLKSLAVAQTTWFIAQIVGRAAQRLSVTTLELFTLGIISCTLLTYMAWWAKPFDVRRHIVLQLNKPLPHNMRPDPKGRLTCVGFSTLNASEKYVAGMACMTLIFGALHLVGWQFYFPTQIEQWGWRVSSLACNVLPLLLLGIVMWGSRWDVSGDYIIFFAMTGLYMLFRIYMMVEMFINLRAVPADVYKTPQWSQYFPSFG